MVSKYGTTFEIELKLREKMRKYIRINEFEFQIMCSKNRTKLCDHFETSNTKFGLGLTEIQRLNITQ